MKINRNHLLVCYECVSMVCIGIHLCYYCVLETKQKKIKLNIWQKKTQVVLFLFLIETTRRRFPMKILILRTKTVVETSFWTMSISLHNYYYVLYSACALWKTIFSTNEKENIKIEMHIGNSFCALNEERWLDAFSVSENKMSFDYIIGSFNEF